MLKPGIKSISTTGNKNNWHESCIKIQFSQIRALFKEFHCGAPKVFFA
jgi:hypothetical protein